jgi:hypothetical protein
MSAEALMWAWEQDAVKGSDYVTLLAFATKADDQGAVWIGPKTLKGMVGVEDRALKRCVKACVEAGLVTRYRRQKRSGAEGSAFTILAMPRETPFPFDNYEFVIGELLEGQPIERIFAPVSQTTPPPCRPGHPPVSQTTPPSVTSEETLTKGEHDVPPAGKGMRVGGKPVNREVWERTLWALGEWNRQTGRALGATTGKGQPSESAKRIYQRLKEWPKLTNGEMSDIIRRTLVSRWWGDDDPSIGVVFGPKVFEENMTRSGRPTSNGHRNGRNGGAEVDYDAAERAMLAIRDGK